MTDDLFSLEKNSQFSSQVTKVNFCQILKASLMKKKYWQYLYIYNIPFSWKSTGFLILIREKSIRYPILTNTSFS